MARPSRTRRSKRADFQAPASPAGERARTRRAQPQPAAPQSQAGVPRERGGVRTFTAESWGELKKVDWPGQRQIMSATVVVLIAVAVVGAYLYVADLAFSRLVRDVLLGF